MLSKDELANGKTFLLRLWDAGGAPRQWVETLRGDTASRWYDIYRRSDWPALRVEALDVFRTGVTGADAARILKMGQCVYIHTKAVKADELGVGWGAR